MKLSILSRLAFICNACLVLALLLKQYPVLPDGLLKSSIVITGYLLSFFINTAAQLGIGAYLLKRKQLPPQLPAYLVVVNALFFIVQLYLLIK